MDEEKATSADLFQVIFDAFCEGDIAFLETHWVEGGFPDGVDGWLGRHWLTSAIMSGNIDAVAWVLGKKPEVNFVDDEGFTALMTALQIEKEVGLVRPGANGTQIAIAIIDLLLGAGANINLRATLDYTALHRAAMWSSPKVVEYLLGKGANPRAFDLEYNPETPVDIAKRMKRWDIHAMLCESAGLRPSGHAK